MSVLTKDLLQTEENGLLTVPEAAKIAGRHPRTIRRWICSGFLKAQKGCGNQGRYRIIRADLTEAIEYVPEQ